MTNLLENIAGSQRKRKKKNNVSVNSERNIMHNIV